MTPPCEWTNSSHAPRHYVLTTWGTSGPTHSVTSCNTWISQIILPCCNQCPVRWNCWAYQRSSGRTQSRGCAVWWYTYLQGMPWAAGQRWSPLQQGWCPCSTGACAGCGSWSAWLLLQVAPMWGTPPQQLQPSTEPRNSTVRAGHIFVLPSRQLVLRKTRLRSRNFWQNLISSFTINSLYISMNIQAQTLV